MSSKKKPADTPAPVIDPEPADAVATDAVATLAPGTKVHVEGEVIGEVLSIDDTTGQAQIRFEGGNRGWFAPTKLSVVAPGHTD